MKISTKQARDLKRDMKRAKNIKTGYKIIPVIIIIALAYTIAWLIA